MANASRGFCGGASGATTASVVGVIRAFQIVVQRKDDGVLLAISNIFFIEDRFRNHVFLAGPVAQVTIPASLATKREVRVNGGVRLRLANRTFVFHGMLLFFVYSSFLLISAPKILRTAVEIKKTSSSRREYSSGEYAEGCPCSDAMKLFCGRNRRHSHRVEARPRSGTRQNLHYAANQVVSIGLGNFYLSNVSGFRDFATRDLNIREIQFPIDLRSHAFEPRFPHEGIIFRRAFDQRRKSAFGVRLSYCRFSVFLVCARLSAQIPGAQILP